MTAIVSQQGKLIQLISANAETIELNTPEGCCAVADPPEQNMYYQNGWIAMPIQPTQHHVFDYALKAWLDLRSLEQVKEQKWSELKKQREATEYGGFTFLGRLFDSDLQAQNRIITAAGLNIEMDWTCQDNSIFTLSADQMLQLKTALAQHIALCHERSRLARQLIHEADTFTEIEVIHF